MKEPAVDVMRSDREWESAAEIRMPWPVTLQVHVRGLIPTVEHNSEKARDSSCGCENGPRARERPTSHMSIHRTTASTATSLRVPVVGDIRQMPLRYDGHRDLEPLCACGLQRYSYVRCTPASHRASNPEYE